MTDDPETLSRYRDPSRRDRMRQVGRLAPALRALPRNPALLIGAAILGVVGIFAWRNRERIVERTAPLIEDARVKGQELIEDAKAMGHELIDEAKAKTQAMSRKGRVRRGAAPESTPPDLH